MILTSLICIYNRLFNVLVDFTLLCAHESGPHIHPTGTQHQRCREPPSIRDTARRDVWN